MDKDRIIAVAARAEQDQNEQRRPAAPSEQRCTNNEATAMRRRDQSPIKRCFDIDEPTGNTPPQQQTLKYGRLVDAHRLAAVSAGGGWWNPTTQELIPILHEDDPNYRQNEAIIIEAIRRWNGGTLK